MNSKARLITALLAAMVITALCSGCSSRQRMGMIKDKKTGLMYGSHMTANLFIDPSQFDNPTIKLTIRNTSGDPAIDLRTLRQSIEASYKSKGYKITTGRDYSLHLDINLRYSGQVSTNLEKEYSFLGTGAGGYAGARLGQNTDTTVIGAASGAAIGAIIGSYSTEDTYIMIADVALGLVDKMAKKRKYVIHFEDTQIKRDEENTGFTSYRRRELAQVAVYAGGDTTSQSQIIGGVRERFKRILEDVI